MTIPYYKKPRKIGVVPGACGSTSDRGSDGCVGTSGGREYSEYSVGPKSSIVVQRKLPDKHWYIYYVSNKSVRTLGHSISRSEAETMARKIIRNAGPLYEDLGNNKVKLRKRTFQSLSR
jgi:hypothetical protein